MGLARQDVDEEFATFYVFRDDIVMFPITYSIPKDDLGMTGSGADRV